MKKCIVVAGSDINNYEYLKTLLNDNDYYIYCDCGLKHLNKLNNKVDLIVGDFDSYDYPSIDKEIIRLPIEKDDTDSLYAIKEALKRGYKDFILLGFIGNRIDHSLVNISILEYLDNNDAKGIIYDDYSTTELIKGKANYIDRECSYFSLINIYGDTNDISISGAKYNLDKAIINTAYQYAISNEVVNDKARIDIGYGKLLLVKILKGV